MPDDLNLVVRYRTLKTQRRNLHHQINQKKTDLEYYKKREITLTKTRWIFIEIARATQSAFKERVESLQTMAIRSVFDRPFEFELRFEESRNRATCVPIIKEGDIEHVPKEDMGGGIIDLASITFRFILWSLSRPQTRKIFILDEPLKFIGKGALLQKAGQMLKELSHRMGFQLIIVTHEPELAEIADKAYHIVHKRRRSIVKVLYQGIQRQVRTLKRRIVR